VSAWRVQARASERRLFLINKQDRPAMVEVTVPASEGWIDRMTPYDPTGAGRTLDAPAVRIDGREVAADGGWPGLRPERVDGPRVQLTLAPGEAAVVSVHTQEEGR
jgi:hypothetical protein